MISIGVSLKLYLSFHESVAWASEVAAVARAHPSTRSGEVRLFVLPSVPAIHAVAAAIGDAPVAVGAQDLFWKESGPYTGAVSGGDLATLGCRYVEIGHAERRLVFGEDASVIRRKLAAAVRCGLIPVLCVGEQDQQTAATAARTCMAQIESAIEDVASDTIPELIVAYEPEWAIGRSEPADSRHIRAVADEVRNWLGQHPRVAAKTLLYGGSAKPGLLTQLDGGVDGLFLGRFAHDPASLTSILDETLGVP